MYAFISTQRPCLMQNLSLVAEWYTIEAIFLFKLSSQ